MEEIISLGFIGHTVSITILTLFLGFWGHPYPSGHARNVTLSFWRVYAVSMP